MVEDSCSSDDWPNSVGIVNKFPVKNMEIYSVSVKGVASLNDGLLPVCPPMLWIH